MATAVSLDQRARFEGLQTKSGVIENGLSFGIGSEQDLKATVKQKTIHRVSSNAAAYLVGGFENQARETSSGEVFSASESGESGTNNNYFWHKKTAARR